MKKNIVSGSEVYFYISIIICLLSFWQIGKLYAQESAVNEGTI